MFTGGVESGCGVASSSTGPFYCSLDEKVYIDLGFYEDLKERFNAPGDFAQAYVIAHEVGHHVQHLMGITDKVHASRERLSEEEYNKLSVKLELQADFLAGVWAHHANNMAQILDPGDIDEALNAASAIGDDRLQMQTQGQVVPDSFTHGTSEQRMRWFKKGFESGDVSQGDTFNTSNL
jgi:predicted metalloprotease